MFLMCFGSSGASGTISRTISCSTGTTVVLLSVPYGFQRKALRVAWDAVEVMREARVEEERNENRKGNT